MAFFSEHELKELLHNNEDENIRYLIEDLAASKEWIDVMPYLTLKSVNKIIEEKSNNFTLITVVEDGIFEGHMSMEYDYNIIFKENHTTKLKGIRLRRTPYLQGEQWDDYVANEWDEHYRVYDISTQEKIVTHYNFEK